MSLWHSAHSFESMKKFEGMVAPVFVLDDEGQKGDFGPAPSSLIETGTRMGLVIRALGSGWTRSTTAARTGSRRAASPPARTARWKVRSRERIAQIRSA